MAINKNYQYFTPNKCLLYCTQLPVITSNFIGITVPSITVTPALTPSHLFDINQPGEKFEYDTITIRFLMDELWDGYAEVLSWMNHLVGTDDTNQVISERTELVADIDLSLHTNLGNQFRKIRFKDCWPTSLVAPELSTEDSEYLPAEAMFYTSGIELIPDTKNLTGLDKTAYTH